MKRADLERHLRVLGCEIKREGAKHTIWTNPATGRVSTVPRHRELPRTTARAICDQMGVARI
ncbi:MAG: type II toxin-antitoxin system HicA family toxin [Actinomycetota bacterium]|nr:type II toxin-antitoxin system HicA family toxin [Actinomycetota bacterium]